MSKKIKWLSVKKEPPSIKNGYIDELVYIAVKNKNKKDGIYLFDLCTFDGEKWLERVYTWEDILFWRPLKDLEEELEKIKGE